MALMSCIKGSSGSGLADITDSCGLDFFTKSGTCTYNSTTRTYTSSNGANASFGFDLTQYVGKFSRVIIILSTTNTSYAFIGEGDSPSYNSSGAQTYRKYNLATNTDMAFAYETDGANNLYFSTGGNTTIQIQGVYGINV